MISNSVTADRHRRASGPARIAPTIERKLRQVEPIYKEDDNDVESAPRPPTPPTKVLRSARRRSSVNRTRETMLRLLRDQNQTSQTHTRTSMRNTILSPVDWLMGSVDDDLPDEDVHEAFQQKRELENRNNAHPWYVLLPRSQFRLTWDFCMAWLLCFLAFYIPFRVCFYWEEAVESKSVFILESTFDAIFALDIIFNFFTAYVDPETSTIVTQPKLIAKKYLKGFFLVDLLATIPFGYILTYSPVAIVNKFGKLGRLPKLIKFARATRFLKLLRIYRLNDFIMKVEIQVRSLFSMK